MKNLLVLAALSMAATPAMASKARMTALGNSVHLTDTQSVFVKVADIHYLGDYATLEFGQTGVNAGPSANPTAPRAEGGFVRSSSMGKWGAYLGRQSATVNDFVATANNSLGAGTLLTEQNTLDLFYGTELAGQNMAFSLHHSAAKLESTSQEANTLGVSFGVRNDVWEAYARIGLLGESKNTAAATTRELKQKGFYDLGFGMWMDTLYLSAKVLSTKGTLSTGTDTDIEKTEYSISAIDNNKVEGGTFFYGVSYANSELKTGTANKSTTTALPFIVGMEVDAASWLVLRGSVTQNVLLGDAKTEAGTTTTDKMKNNTVVAAGAGLKFNKLMIDGTLAGATGSSNATNGSGNISGNELLANASMTYMF